MICEFIYENDHRVLARITGNRNEAEAVRMGEQLRTGQSVRVKEYKGSDGLGVYLDTTTHTMFAHGRPILVQWYSMPDPDLT